MRVVAGKFRAKKLFGPDHNIRPTLDKVKQALFTRLQFDIENSVVLDLFSGSGAMGIEALSRNAKKVIFCDIDEKSIKLTKKNLSSLKIDETQQVFVKKINYIDFLKSTDEKFDLIILDPPYESGYYLPALEQIYSRNLLNDNGIIVCERLKNSCIEQEYFDLECTKNYGSVSLDYFTKKS